MLRIKKKHWADVAFVEEIFIGNTAKIWQLEKNEDGSRNKDKSQNDLLKYAKRLLQSELWPNFKSLSCSFNLHERK